MGALELTIFSGYPVSNALDLTYKEEKYETPVFSQHPLIVTAQDVKKNICRVKDVVLKYLSSQVRAKCLKTVQKCNAGSSGLMWGFCLNIDTDWAMASQASCGDQS
jgi:hypothetical protein